MAAPSIVPPPPAHLPDNTYHDPTLVGEQESQHSSDDEREATELRLYSTASTSIRRRGRNQSDPGVSHSAENGHASLYDARSQSLRSSRGGTTGGWWGAVQRWWSRQISVTVPAGSMRDHLALERTFLGYLRTSIALSMVGALIAQLFRLQPSHDPDPVLGYYVVGIPLAATFICAAIAVTVLGAWRFWRQQNAMVRGKIHAGGWEVVSIMVGSLVISFVLFALCVGIDIRKSYERYPFQWRMRR